MVLVRCGNLGELHKDIIGVNIRGSSTEALAFWYNVYMGYESMLHWGEGGCPPPDPLPITPPLPTPCALSYFILFYFI
jgi:hypothetical protein